MTKNEQKYLSISMKTGDALNLVLKAIAEGKEYINFAAFKKDKQKENSPHYSSKNCAVWISKFTPKEEQKNDNTDTEAENDI